MIKTYLEIIGGALLLIGWFMLLGLLSLVPDGGLWTRMMEVLP
jgi:hypothetical protein